MESQEEEVLPPPIWSPAEGPRNYFGWVTLSIILGALIALNLFAYLGRKPSDSYGSASFDGVLRQAMMAKALTATSANAGIMDPFEDFAGELASARKSSIKSLRYYVVVRFEQGKQVQPEDFSLLESSKEPRDKILAQIYTSRLKDSNDAQVLAKKLSGDDFVVQVARSHAYSRAGDKGPRQALIPSWRILAMTLAGGVLLIAFVAGVVFLGIYWVKKPVPLGIPLADISLADADVVALRTAVLLVGYIFVSVFLSFLKLPDLVGSAVMGLILVSMSLALCRYAVPSGQMTAIRLGLSLRNFKVHAKWGIAAAAANVPLLMMATAFSLVIFQGLPSPEHPLTKQLAGNPSWITIGLAIVVASVCAPIFEEICFRGHLFPALARVTGSLPIAVGLSSFAFAAIHPTGIPAWLPLMVIGAVGCKLTHQTKSLIPSIVMHATHNLGVVLISLALT